jgi:hypothetical protein
LALPWLPLIHASIFALQPAANAGKLNAIENAIVAMIPPDFHISFLRNLAKAIESPTIDRGVCFRLLAMLSRELILDLFRLPCAQSGSLMAVE